MSEKKTPDDYKVGYRKPPKDTQFRKGMTGNPKGRPKKSLDRDHEFLRESNFQMTVNENGRSIRISKHEIIIKQLINQAAKGNPQAQRLYFYWRQKAHEKVALEIAPKCFDAEEFANNPNALSDIKSLTDAQLDAICILAMTDQEREATKNMSAVEIVEFSKRQGEKEDRVRRGMAPLPDLDESKG